MGEKWAAVRAAAAHLKGHQPFEAGVSIWAT